MDKKTQTFINKARMIHGEKYDYSNVIYKNNKSKIKIICPIHGPITQTPSNHLRTCGCSQCGKDIAYDMRGRVTTDQFISKAKGVHGDKYDYSKVVYVKSNLKIKIICPIHGEFEQEANSHLVGHGCPDCGRENTIKSNFMGDDKFIEKSMNIHGGKYDYSKVDYTGNKNDVIIICPVHGEFTQTPDAHLAGKGCIKCFSFYGRSNAERELYDFIKSITDYEIVSSDRDTLDGKEIDIFIPDLNCAIEYNGIYWHSSDVKSDYRNYHINKTRMCEDIGIHLIHVWSDDWINNKDVVKNMISAKLHCIRPMGYARKMKIIYPVSIPDQRSFYDAQHIQGYGTGSIVYGLMNHDGDYTSMMSFARRGDQYELTRFASNNIIGSFNRLLKRFRDDHPGVSIFSFGSRDVVYRHNNIYINNGFIESDILGPDYMYVVHGERINKRRFRKDKLIKENPSLLNSSMTERIMTEKLNIPRIYGCGLIRYTLMG